MRASLLLLTMATTALLSSFTKPKKLIITSPAFANNSPIPVKYTCVGSQFSPPLHIADIPAGTKSLAVVIYDPEAVVTTPNPPKKTVPVSKKKGKNAKAAPRESTSTSKLGFTNWIVWNIEVTNNIPENFRTDHIGVNEVKGRGYAGMCPQSGSHTYHFIVYALDTELNVDGNTNKQKLESVMEGHILGKGELTGTFDKTYK